MQYLYFSPNSLRISKRRKRIASIAPDCETKEKKKEETRACGIGKGGGIEIGGKTPPKQRRGSEGGRDSRRYASPSVGSRV